MIVNVFKQSRRPALRPSHTPSSNVELGSLLTTGTPPLHDVISPDKVGVMVPTLPKVALILVTDTRFSDGRHPGRTHSRQVVRRRAAWTNYNVLFDSPEFSRERRETG